MGRSVKWSTKHLFTLDISQYSRIEDQTQCFLNLTAVFCIKVRVTEVFCQIWENKAGRVQVQTTLNFKRMESEIRYAEDKMCGTVTLSKSQ